MSVSVAGPTVCVSIHLASVSIIAMVSQRENGPTRMRKHQGGYQSTEGFLLQSDGWLFWLFYRTIPHRHKLAPCRCIAWGPCHYTRQEDGFITGRFFRPHFTRLDHSAHSEVHGGSSVPARMVVAAVCSIPTFLRLFSKLRARRHTIIAFPRLLYLQAQLAKYPGICCAIPFMFSRQPQSLCQH
ncbi:hypothetical protein GGR54DRAFT_289178 [Hypoxylon sp. NC1633]|nr:hypothetical protein GGR54DRAFT_289178 [Hypoxylon sp. NC1633]